MIPHQNKSVEKYVDGGYLSWVFGTAGRKSWISVRSSYSMKSGALILVDSRTSARKEYYPLYKSHREEKREKNLEKTEGVREFQKLILEDPSLRKFEIEGLEADDLIALMIFEKNLPVIGRDKDLLQLPGINLQTISEEQITLKHYAKSLPKSLGPLIRKPSDVLFSLVLMGDKSDDIPRLLPSREMALGQKLMNLQNPWPTAYSLFGDQLLRNLYLAVLPSPFCFKEPPDPSEVFHSVKIGKWPPRGVLRKDITDYFKEYQHVLFR